MHCSTEIPLVENPEYTFSDPDDFPDKLTMGDKFTDPNTIGTWCPQFQVFKVGAMLPPPPPNAFVS
jgi:hypothetical protein